ncbi:MAG: MFS transporter [Gammaproteobacteria bacterium]|nr:MFS transporter [Gammaproteobacteria bacterium]
MAEGQDDSGLSGSNQQYGARAALSSRNFRVYLSGSIFSLLGIWIQRLAIGWHAWQLTESAFIVGVVAAVQFLPVLILTPFFGVMADRIQSRSGVIVMNTMMGGIAMVLGLITLNGSMSIEILVGLALLHGVVVSAYTPTRLSLIPDLVPQYLFPSAVAISAILFNLSRFVGPGIAGVVVAAWGLGWAYINNALTYLPVITALFLLRIDAASTPVPNRKPYLVQLTDGLRYTRGHAKIREALLLAGVCAFFGRGILEIMPAFAALIFEGDSRELALLMSSAGLGAIFGSLIYSTGRLALRVSLVLFAGATLTGVSLASLGFAGGIGAGMLVVLVLGFATSVVSVGTQTQIQVKVENELRGRVMSLWSLLSMGGAALGSLVAGAVSREFNASISASSFGAACLLGVVVIALRRRFDSRRH